MERQPFTGTFIAATRHFERIGSKKKLLFLFLVLNASLYIHCLASEGNTF